MRETTSNSSSTTLRSTTAMHNGQLQESTTSDARGGAEDRIEVLQAFNVDCNANAVWPTHNYAASRLSHAYGSSSQERILRRPRLPSLSRLSGEEPPSPTTSIPASSASDRTRVESAWSQHKYRDGCKSVDAERVISPYSFAATPAPQREKERAISSSTPFESQKRKTSLQMLFASLRRRDLFILVLPAIALSVVSGALPPLMTRILGDAFDSYTAYNPMGLPSSSITQAAKDKLIRDIVRSVWQLGALALATMLLSTSMVSAWICIGERNARRLRDRLYGAISTRHMEWFDRGMGLEETPQGDKEGDDITGESTGEGSSNSRGAGGLLAKFAREADEVRVATSQQFGQLLQHVTTTLACLALALASKWDLTLVILAGIPLTVVITIICEVMTGPLLTVDREATAETASIVERVIIAISTVKAFNAESREAERFSHTLKKGSAAYNRTTFWWAVRLGSSSTLMFAMFVQGFWYGSHLVQTGKASAGTVMTVFWSSLLASSHLQMVIQGLTVIEKGKISISALSHLMDPPRTTHPAATDVEMDTESRRSSVTTLRGPLPPPPKSPQPAKRGYSHAVSMSIDSIPHLESPGSPASPLSPPQVSPKSYLPFVKPSRKLQRHPGEVKVMRRIMPTSRAQGEISLHNVTFAYPTRPCDAVLRDVSLYLPAGDTTYIVGGSGSGKSTVTQLVLGLYQPQAGMVALDNQDLRFLDRSWRRTHVAAVTQQPIIFDLSVHDNVAIGLCGLEDASSGLQTNHIPVVSRERIIDACRVALIHDFVRDLPEGYDTALGVRGTSLSGGQKQRIAIARACLRNPTVLILDEATSALDPASRLLVNEAVKRRRRGRSTIIVTHDLSQIEADDFVYLLDSGVVAEQGYRGDLEERSAGRFAAMATLQKSSAPVDGMQQLSTLSSQRTGHPTSPTGLDARAALTLSQIAAMDHTDERSQSSNTWKRASVAPFVAPMVTKEIFNVRPSTSSGLRGLRPLHLPEQQQRRAVEEAPWLQFAGIAASTRRHGVEMHMRRKWTAEEIEDADKPTTLSMCQEADVDAVPPPRVREVAIAAWRTQPRKVLFLFGIFCSIASGGVTPAFSYVLAQLLATMGRTGQGRTVLRYSLLVLLLAFVEGIFAFLRSWVMELVADGWVSSLRRRAYSLVLAQDRTWFDEPRNTPTTIVTHLVKDADDARDIVARVVGQLSVVVAMIAVGILWSMIVGWELTLVGLAFGPVFIIVMGLQSRYVTRAEAGNKTRREAVSKRFYDMVSNVRGIRAMGLESVFSATFNEVADEAQAHGMRSAWLSGLGFGLGEALTYLAEALMFCVGAVLVRRGTYDFERMVIVFNLIIFAVSFAASTMAYLPNISKAIAAMHDLSRLLVLPLETSETPGTLTPTISGHIAFRNVAFSYATRKEVPVLHGLTFDVGQGETVAIVGGSGSGKSTIVSLVQRLYEPAEGSILLDGRPLGSIATKWLREHIAVVSQTPNLFDMTIANNIAYGANAAVLDSQGKPLVASNEVRTAVVSAAETARVDDFVRSLPRGYDTPVGADATLISGGQAQRLAIARALVRTQARVLILDECTSALDAVNADAIARTLLGSDNGEESIAAQRTREGRDPMTTLVVTHKVDLMRRCDRILVIEGGTVVQQGTYAQLMSVRSGKFAQLASAGEWSG